MKLRKKIVKQVLLLLRNIEGEEVKMGEIEPIYLNGELAGYRFRIEAKEKPRLKIVKGQRD